MSTNKIFRVICSLPVVFISLYFIPFLGICLIIFRQFIYKDRKKYSTSISIMTLGILMFIPKVIYEVLKVINIKAITIPYLNDIVKSNMYDNLMDYGKFLLILGVILLIISYILKSVIEKIENSISSLMHSSINSRIEMEREIDKENDLQIKLKQEKAKNTNYVKCPNCGSDNILSDKVGTCKFCRRKIVNKGYNV